MSLKDSGSLHFPFPQYKVRFSTGKMRSSFL